MILDNYLNLSGAWAAGVWTPQLITATGNTTSTNVIDLANTKQAQVGDFGQGQKLKVEINIVNSLTSGGSATVQFAIIQADDAGMSTNVGVLNQTDAYAYTLLTAGTIVPIVWDWAAPYPARRYVALRYIIGTAVLTNGTGQFIANVVTDVQDKGANTIFQSGFAVS